MIFGKNAIGSKVKKELILWKIYSNTTEHLKSALSWQPGILYKICWIHGLGVNCWDLLFDSCGLKVAKQYKFHNNAFLWYSKPEGQHGKGFQWAMHLSLF